MQLKKRETYLLERVDWEVQKTNSDEKIENDCTRKNLGNRITKKK